MTITDPPEPDYALEPDVLTTRDQTKVLPCRICHRPCVVTRFASAAKTVCLHCRAEAPTNGQALEFDESLAAEVQTGRDQTKDVPCRTCRRRCTVTRFAASSRVECSQCRGAAPAGQALQFNEELPTEVLTDHEATKELPCATCQRRCVVTLFAAPSKVKCLTCRGRVRAARKQEVQVAKAHTLDPATLDNLSDALINPVFRNVPHCPFDPEHSLELKSVVHSPNYGPRRFAGWVKGLPRWDQETGESVTYQCLECLTIVSYSTQHPVPLQAQNEARRVAPSEKGSLELILGVRAA